MVDTSPSNQGVVLGSPYTKTAGSVLAITSGLSMGETRASGATRSQQSARKRYVYGIAEGVLGDISTFRLNALPMRRMLNSAKQPVNATKAAASSFSGADVESSRYHLKANCSTFKLLTLYLVSYNSLERWSGALTKGQLIIDMPSSSPRARF